MSTDCASFQAPSAEQLLPFREWLAALAPAGSLTLDVAAAPLPDLFEAALAAAAPTDADPALAGLRSLRWDLPASVFPSLAANLIAHKTAVLDAVAASVANPTFASTLGAIAEADRRTQPLAAAASFLAEVSPCKAVRDAANDAQEALQAYAVDAAARVDVYRAVRAYADSADAKGLTGEAARLLAHSLRDFERDGLALPEAERAQLVAIKKRISALCINFAKNVAEENTTFTLTKQQLEGLSADQLGELPKGDAPDTYVVSLKTPDYVPVMDYCRVPATRALLEQAYKSRCKEENAPLLAEVVRLRAQAAPLLGFPTWRAYILDTLMAKTPAAVDAFLSSFNGKLTPLYAQEQAALLKLKQEDEPAATALLPSDRAYYARVYEERQYSVDHEALRAFFPLEHVTAEMFALFELLFQVKITKVEGAQLWHADAAAYKVTDTAEGAEGAALGVLFMDLHPRAGKYSHAAVFTLLCPAELADGSRALPAAGLVCNFPAATAERPALLPHKDLVTYLHECGHALHLLLGKPRFARFEGLNIERDAVECPSQLLENWAYSKPALARLAKHYADAGKTLPAETVDALVASARSLAGTTNKHYLASSVFDQRLHARAADDASPVDAAALYAEVLQEVMGFAPTAGTDMSAAFGHLTGGYDAQYYSYQWAEVFSVDLFKSKFEAAPLGELDGSVGAEYRRKVLQPGSSKDAAELLADFLGRAPSDDAFMKSKGL